MGQLISAQVLTNQPTNPAINNSNVFLDASTSYSTGANDETTGKGLVFPDVDLTKFKFDLAYADGTTFPTYFDGMVVYNTGSGETGEDLATQGIKVKVTPGFYYFSNPEGKNDQNIEKGKWVRIGGGSSNSDAEIVKGTFTNPGTNTVKIAKPDGFATLASIKMYRKSGDTGTKHLVGTSLYSYEEVTEASGETNLKLVFGNGVISTAYPKGEYEYELEYIKQ